VNPTRAAASRSGQPPALNPGFSNEDQAVGIKVLSRSIEGPPRQIVANAGEDASVVLAEGKKGKGTFGYAASACPLNRRMRNRTYGVVGGRRV
jgi:chaperonin GroEL (HSP60 family)